MGFALQKCENHCDTDCNLPLQGLDADNCHTAAAGFYDAKKVVVIVDGDDSKVVCVCGQTEDDEDQGGYCPGVLATEDNPRARLTTTGQTYLAAVFCM
jgi:hypothetical protein